jgi:hypothetical protein
LQLPHRPDDLLGSLLILNANQILFDGLPVLILLGVEEEITNAARGLIVPG